MSSASHTEHQASQYSLIDFTHKQCYNFHHGRTYQAGADLLERAEKSAPQVTASLRRSSHHQPGYRRWISTDQ